MKTIWSLCVFIMLVSEPVFGNHLNHAINTHGNDPGSRGEAAQVMVVGTYHFNNPGLDVIKTDVPDIFSEKKQQEIREVLDALNTFRPTKIVVEWPSEINDELNALFTAYLADEHRLSASETQQLGFRLARQNGHPQIYAIDEKGEFPFGEMMGYAQTHEPEFVATMMNEIAELTRSLQQMYNEQTIKEILRTKNNPEQLKTDHGFYLMMTSVGAGDGWAGANLVSKWYERNIRIHGNLRKITEPGDRVIVIFGSGHAPILRELITYDPGMELVETNDFLPAQ